MVSPSGQKMAIVRKHAPDKKKPSDEKWFVEVWVVCHITEFYD